MERWPKITFEMTVTGKRSASQQAQSSKFQAESSRIKEMFEEAKNQICRLDAGSERYLWGRPQAIKLVKNGRMALSARLNEAGLQYTHLQSSYVDRT